MPLDRPSDLPDDVPLPADHEIPPEDVGPAARAADPPPENQERPAGSDTTNSPPAEDVTPGSGATDAQERRRAEARTREEYAGPNESPAPAGYPQNQAGTRAPEAPPEPSGPDDSPPEWNAPDEDPPDRLERSPEPAPGDSRANQPAEDQDSPIPEETSPADDSPAEADAVTANAPETPAETAPLTPSDPPAEAPAERAGQPEPDIIRALSPAIDQNPPEDVSPQDATPSDHQPQPPTDPSPRDTPLRPLTDKEWAEYIAEVIDDLDDARKAGQTARRLYTVNGAGEIWTKERDALHESLLNDLYAQAAHVPCEHKAIVAGGLSGAGKTTILTRNAGIDLSQYLIINPDSIKEEMALRNMIPVIGSLSPMEASDLVHEESSYLAKRLDHRAEADGRNVIWDITMSSEESTSERIENLRSSGYERVEAIFVDISIETSIRRTDSRHREGHENYRNGRGMGGRYVPEQVIKEQADPEWCSKNRRIFENMKHKFNRWSVYDNSVDSREPILIDSSSQTHHHRHLGNDR